MYVPKESFLQQSCKLRRILDFSTLISVSSLMIYDSFIFCLYFIVHSCGKWSQEGNRGEGRKVDRQTDIDK